MSVSFFKSSINSMVVPQQLASRIAVSPPISVGQSQRGVTTLVVTVAFAALGSGQSGLSIHWVVHEEEMCSCRHYSK